MSGIENLSVDHAGSGTAITSGIYFYNAYNCWVRNVRSLNSNRNHVWFYQSAHVTARDSYFYGTANAASQSYGAEQFMGADNLVENNIFHHITAPMMNAGATGSVFGYNYAIDDYYFASAWQQSSSYHHAAGNSFILWEGNDGPGLTADNIHGSSHFITAFRNVWLGWEPGKTQETIPIHLEAWNRYYNFVGNVLGKIGYHTRYEAAASSSTDAGNASVGDQSIYTVGYSGNEGTILSPIPNDTLVKVTMMRWANYDTVHAVTQCRARHSGAAEFLLLVGQTVVVDRDALARDRTRRRRRRGSDRTRVQDSRSRMLRHHVEDRWHLELQRGQLLSRHDGSRRSDKP
jgi:hypothetical protein